MNAQQMIAEIHQTRKKIWKDCGGKKDRLLALGLAELKNWEGSIVPPPEKAARTKKTTGQGVGRKLTGRTRKLVPA